MKQTLLLLLAVVVVVGGGYWLLSQSTGEAPATSPDETSETEAPAQPAPEDVADVPTAPTDYVGLSEAEAVVFAEENNVPFRVVERDGEMLPTTRDYRPGRINAVVANGVVVSYAVEGSEDVPNVDKGDDAPTTDEATAPGEHDAIIGMTETEAEAYAAANEVPFRIGSIDGEARPVTMDYRPGRITVSIEDGIVTSYSVE